MVGVVGGGGVVVVVGGGGVVVGVIGSIGQCLSSPDQHPSHHWSISSSDEA